MSALALEACMRRARELDTTGVAIDYQIAAIDRDVAEGIFLQNQLNAELSTLNDYSEKDMEDLQRRVIRHEDLAQKFQSEFPDYQQSSTPTKPLSPNLNAIVRDVFPVMT